MQAPPTARDILVLAQIVDLVRDTDGATRSWIEAETGLGRAVVNDRLTEGIELGILEELDPVAEKGRRGRPSRSLRFRAEAGVVLSACLGAGSMHAAVSDLDGEPIAKIYRDIDVGDGPEKTLRTVHRTFQRLIAKAGPDASVWGIAIGVPGPVEFRTGRVVAPPIMPGWDGFDVRSWFQAEIRRPGLGRQRGQPDGLRRVVARRTARAARPALREGGHRDRCRSGDRRPPAPRRQRGCGRHRPRARHRRQEGGLPLRQDRLPRSRRRRLGHAQPARGRCSCGEEPVARRHGSRRTVDWCSGTSVWPRRTATRS